MKYAIIHVNNRSIENIEHNKRILSDLKYIDDIEYFNGNLGNPWDVINHIGVRQDVWSPYDGRSFPPLPGELGIWISTINIWKYIIDNKIDRLLVLEDDIRLQDDFMKKFIKAAEELPENFDFLSLYYFEDQNAATEGTDCGLEYIHKSNNQFSAGQAIFYSLFGAKKLLKLIHRKGIEYTTDCFIFKQSHLGLVNGFSIKQENTFFLKHDYHRVKSLIDPDNLRKVEM